MTRVHLSLLDASPAKAALLSRGQVAGEFLELPDADFKAACAPFIRRGLGDHLAALLHRLRIDAAAALLVRRGLISDCQCAARQARLNALTPRLRALLEPWPLTSAVLLAWLLLLALLLAS